MLSNDHEMTPEQQEVFDFRPLDLVITAPAGCGKTEALAFRAKGILERYNFTENDRRLLIISFTNQAKDNIGERLKQHIDAQRLRQHITVCNFHGLAGRIIRAHGNMIGLDSCWTIANFDWVGRFARTLNCSRKTQEQAKLALQHIKINSTTDSEVMNKIQTIEGNIGLYARKIEEARVNEKVITYDDQIRVALWILRDARVMRIYRNHFLAALVDEFQDLTHQQLDLVRSLCGKNVTYAGDLAQSIYSFAGADAKSTFQEITKNGIKQIKLLKSFRSSPAVLNAVNSLSPLTGCDHLLAAHPKHWGDGGIFSFASFHNEENESDWIAHICKSILNHCPNHRVGIITRTAYRADKIKQTFKTREIEYIDWGDGRFESKTAATLQAVCDVMPDKLPDSMSECFSLIRQKAIAIQGSTSEDLEDGCGWLFDQIIRANGSGLSEIRRRIGKRNGSETIATHHGVHCLTGHAGKGQQFDWVIIAGLEQGSIPDYRAKSPEELNEEARVLSVMISRARIGAITTASAIVRRHRKEKSQFLSYLRKTPDFLYGQSNINSWFTEADWSIIARM